MLTSISDLGILNFNHILIILIVFIIITKTWNIDWILKFLMNYIKFVTLLTPILWYLNWLIENKLAISQWKSAIHSKAMMLAYIFLVTARQKNVMVSFHWSSKKDISEKCVTLLTPYFRRLSELCTNEILFCRKISLCSLKMTKFWGHVILKNLLCAILTWFNIGMKIRLRFWNVQKSVTLLTFFTIFFNLIPSILLLSTWNLEET